MKDRIISKIVGIDYNNNLEEVLSKKDFSEEVKNTLLSMFYKIENSYNDYKTIKPNTFNITEYIERLIKIIEKDCMQIEFTTKSNEEEVVDRKKKKIICQPKEPKILYSLAKIQKSAIVVKYMDSNIEEALSFMLNTGNNISMVEPLRDFNGFSWYIDVRDMESINCNLLYQNIIYIAGDKFVDKWVNNYEPLVNYFKLFENKIEDKYGEKLKNEIITKIINISIKIKSEYDPEFAKKIEKKTKKLKELAKQRENILEYINEISNKKKEKEKQIKKIDEIMFNNELLVEEQNKYENISIDEVKENLKTKRNKLLKEIEKYNKEITPKEFLAKKEEISKQLSYYDIGKDYNIKKNLVMLQKYIIKCMRIDLKKATTKKKMINLIYNYRYYNYLPLDEERFILNVKALEKSVDQLTQELIAKAIQMKIITKISNNEEVNFKITEQLLLSKIISLENINIEITKTSSGLYLTVFDEEIKEIRIKLEDIEQEDINIKLNKKTKLFI